MPTKIVWKRETDTSVAGGYGRNSSYTANVDVYAYVITPVEGGGWLISSEGVDLVETRSLVEAKSHVAAAAIRRADRLAGTGVAAIDRSFEKPGWPPSTVGPGPFSRFSSMQVSS